MGDLDHEMADGWQAAYDGHPLDTSKSPAWQDGWQAFASVVIRFPRAFQPPRPVEVVGPAAPVRKLSPLETLTRSMLRNIIGQHEG